MHWTTAYAPQLCQHDIFLMAAFHRHGYHKKDLRKLNFCRHWLGVHTLNNICMFDGLFIDPDIWAGKRSFNFQAPLSQQPDCRGPSFWTLWIEAIQRAFTLPNSRTLRQPLSSWLPKLSTTTEWLYEAALDWLLHQQASYWQVWIPHTRRQLRHSIRRYKPSDLVLTTPEPSWQPTLVCHSWSSLVQVTGTATISDTVLPPHTSLWDSILQGHDSSIDALMVQDIELHSDLAATTAIEFLKQGLLCITSDSSYKSSLGTSAFCVRDPSGPVLISGSNDVPGQGQSAFWSELAGICGAVLLLQALCQTYAITSGAVTLGLDREGAINAIRNDYRPKPSQPSFDLVTHLKHTISSLPMQVHWQWIKGHQDRVIQHLTLWEIDNIQVNAISQN